MDIVNFIVRKTRPLSKLLGVTSLPGNIERTNREVCEMLQAYYDNNNLYDVIVAALKEAGVSSPALRSLRNPTAAVVEFYAATVWPGALPDALPIVGEQPLVDAVHDIWRRSNWGERKQLAVRQAAITGDVFMRVATNGENKPYIQVVLTKNVSAWTEDHAGNITALRYETCERVKAAGQSERKEFHTEIWEGDECRIYKHARGYNSPESQLGDPVKTITHGLPFVPWVRACFRDVGEPFGYPAIWCALDKIDEINLKATRLAQLMFRNNKATWALMANATDAQGRPMPAPKIERAGDTVPATSAMSFADNDIIALPGTSTLQSLIAGIDWAAHADAVAADIEAIKNDLPELRWYELTQASNASGVALAYQMQPAIARVIEVRGSLERALVRVNMMAITQGQKEGLYTDVGEYDTGATQHRFRERPVLPTTPRERAEIVQILRAAGLPLALTLREYAGWTEEQLGGLEQAIAGEQVARSGATAGPGADPAVQSAVRVAARDAAGPGLEKAIADATGGAVERALDQMTAQLAEFLGGRAR